MSAPAAPPQALLSHRQILTIFAGLMIGMFLAALDQTVVATSIRTIADDLDGLSLQAWATTAYLITGTISTPLYGKLSDLYGRKPLFLAAIGIFVGGSVLCTFVGSMYQLAAFRAVQGLGAGGLFSLALTIIGDVVAPRERARYQGYFVAVFGTSSVLGPVAGGFFAGQAELLGITGWRWVFLLNVPLGIVALVVVSRVLNIPHVRREHRIDWAGALALTVALVPLLIVAEQGRAWGWTSPRALLCYLVGVAGLVAFVQAERRIGDDALLPLRFFRTGVFAWGSLAGFVAGMGMFGALALLPLYLQIVKGSTPTQAGLQTLPLVLGIMSMSVFSGQFIARTGRYKIWPVVGLTLMIIGIGLLSRVGVDTPYWRTALIMVLIGWGLGGNMQPLTLAVQNAMPPKDMGVATASATFFRQMGGTLGTAVFLSVLFAALPGRIVDAFRTAATDPAFTSALRDPAVLADPANKPVLGALQGGTAPNIDDSSFLSSVDPVLARPILEGFASAMSTVFVSAAAILVIGLVAVLKMREVPLRAVSGVEARRGDDPALAAATPAGATSTARPATTDGLRPWRRMRPAGGDGARVVVTRELPGSDPTAGPPSRSARRNGNRAAGSGGDGPAAAVLPPAPPRLAADAVASEDRERSTPSGEGLSASGPGAGGRRSSDAAPPADPRDRLLAMLLPDPPRALAVIADAERARDAARRARRELADHSRDLDRAGDELVAQGLSPAQVCRLLELTDEEAPDRGGRHRSVSAPAGSSED